MTACLPIQNTEFEFLGVACVDMLMRDLIADITEFQNLDIGYTFMINSGGRQFLPFCLFSYRTVANLHSKILDARLPFDSIFLLNGYSDL